MAAHRRHRQALLTTLALDLDSGEQFVDLFLNGGKPDHLLEPVEHLVGAPRSGHRGDYVQASAGRVAFPGRNKPEATWIAGEPHRDIGQGGSGDQNQKDHREPECERPGHAGRDNRQRAVLRIQDPCAHHRSSNADYKEAQHRPLGQEPVHRLISYQHGFPGVQMTLIEAEPFKLSLNQPGVR
jgi:hypothetical protein